MKYLLDTHALLWIALDDNRLSKKVRKVYSDTNSELYISIASLWEIAIKVSIKKIQLNTTFDEFINLVIQNGISILELKTEHLNRVAELQFIHRDPFDRILISQAQSEKLTIITSDKIFKNYKVKMIW